MNILTACAGRPGCIRRALCSPLPRDYQPAGRLHAPLGSHQMHKVVLGRAQCPLHGGSAPPPASPCRWAFYFSASFSQLGPSGFGPRVLAACSLHLN